MIHDEMISVEEAALGQFVSSDTTRPHLATIWRYASEGGRTYAASDGHTIAIRRSGKHRDMPLHEIEKLPPFALESRFAESTAFRFSQLFAPLLFEGAPPRYRGINPSYVARVARVEGAAGYRAAQEWTPPPGRMSKKQEAKERVERKLAFSSWQIGNNEFAPWLWVVSTFPALWEGAIMPRRP